MAPREAVIIWDEPEFDFVFRSWPGPVGRHLSRVGLKTQAGAKARAPKETGRLITRIKTKKTHHRRDLEMHVGTGLGGRRMGYAYTAHEAPLTFRIRPRRARALVFPVSSGRIIVAQQVMWRRRNNATRGYLFRSLRRSL